jgi:hypothetical protein
MTLLRAGVLAACIQILFTASGQADQVAIGFINSSSADVTDLRLVSQTTADADPVNLLAAPLAPAQRIDIPVAVTDDDCLFTLRLAFSSGATRERADLDLCQSTTVTIE